jgi:lambda family phage minor tail protein L
MTVAQDVTRLAPMQMVEMFMWDDKLIQGGGNILRWHPGTTVARGPIYWQGVEYQQFPIEANGFEMQSSGKLPRPTIRVANIGGSIGAYIRGMKDGLGAAVTRKRTLGKYLDAVNFPSGNPYADPNTHFNDELFYVARKVAENPIYVELELAVKFDVEGIKLPRRQVIAGTCQWIYRSAECSYSKGPILNDPTYPGVDKCGKSLDSCKLRFGANGVLPTSAFPASMLARYV